MGFSRVFGLMQCASRVWKSSPAFQYRRKIVPPIKILSYTRFSTATEPYVEEWQVQNQKLGFRANQMQGIQSVSEEKSGSEQNGATVKDEATDYATFELEHPWPEWISFMQRLAEMNYFSVSAAAAPVSPSLEKPVRNIFSDLNIVRNACISFGRDRYDILRSLSTELIKTIVEYGCPNLDRKVVNSGKRLRAYVNLVEGDVCSTCNVRSSCDRAFMKAPDEEGARTVDIMRILLIYGLDPLVGVAENKLHDQKQVKDAICNLLKEVVELSKVPVDPNIPKPVPQQPLRRIPFSPTREIPNDTRMKKGDWICQRCNMLNFARNSMCIKCRERRPREEMNPGEWQCPQCYYLNFRKNITCLRCDCKRPEDASGQNYQQSQAWKFGDWRCPECKFMNFRRNSRCLKCDCECPNNEHTRMTSYQQLNTGDWKCPECNFLNFRRNTECMKCKCKPDMKDVQTSELQGRGNYKPVDDGGFIFDDFPVRGGRKPVGRMNASSNLDSDNDDDEFGDDSRDTNRRVPAHGSIDDEDDDGGWFGSPQVMKAGSQKVSPQKVSSGFLDFDDEDDDDGWFGRSQGRKQKSQKVSLGSRSRGHMKSFQELNESSSDSDDSFAFENEKHRTSKSRFKRGSGKVNIPKISKDKPEAVDESDSLSDFDLDDFDDEVTEGNKLRRKTEDDR